MKQRLRIWIVGFTLALAALVALCAFVLRASQLSDIQQRSSISNNLWLIDLDSQLESFPWARLAQLARAQGLAVGFPYYQKTDTSNKPQPTLQPLNAEWVRQVMPLKQGKLPQTKDELLAVENGAYKIGEKVAAYRVVGLLAPSPWRPVSDATLFQLVALEQDRPPVPPTMVLVSAAKRETAVRLARAIVGNSGISFSVEPALNAVLVQGFKNVELQSLNTVSRLSAFLLFLALLGLCDALAAMWAAKREEWRTERALGRPARALAIRCLRESLGYWLPGLVLAGLGAAVLAQLLRVPETTGQVVLITLVFVMVALGVMVLFAWRIASFPLARTNLEGRRTWKDALIPFGCTALIAFSGALLLSDALERRSFASTRIAALGADRIDIKPDYSSSVPLESGQCKAIMELVEDCLAYGVVNAPPQVKNTAIPDWHRVTLMDAESARVARLEVVMGRWPQSGKHEVALTQTAFEQAKALGVQLNERLDNRAPFVLVGVVKDYAGRDVPDFANPIFASPDDVLFTRFPRVAPLGTSGMVIHTRRSLEPTIRAIRERIGSRVTVERPAALMLNYRDKAERDLFRIGLLLGIAGLICFQVFASFVGNLIARMAMEVALWRTLGMTRTRVARQLLRLTLEPIMAGLVASLIALSGSLAFGWVIGNLGLASSVLVGIGTFLVVVSSGVALLLVRNWTRLSPRELLLNLESA